MKRDRIQSLSIRRGRLRQSAQILALLVPVFGVATLATLNIPQVKAALPAPGGIDSGLIAWQKANDGTVSPSNWADQSGNGNDAYMTVAFNQPAVVANGINFNPAVDFNGPAKYYRYDSPLGIVGTGDFSSVTVTLFSDFAGHPIFSGSNPTTQGQLHLQYSSAGNLWAGSGGGVGGCTGITNSSTNLATNIPGISSGIRDSSVMTVRLNSHVATQGQGPCTSDFSATANRTLGGRPGTNYMNGLVPETIHYGRALSDTELQRVNSYLAVKYGITLPSVNYLDSNENVIWDRTTNAPYNNNITGIGRDDNSALNQKQSKSVNPQGIVTVGHGDIATDNVSNTNNFTNDLTFLMFGDDNSGVDSWVDTGIPAFDSQDIKQIPRTWKVQRTGTVDPLTVSFDVNDPNANIASPLDNYYLLNLTTGQATLLSSSDGNNYSVSGVNFNDGDVFTIGTFDIQYNVHFKKTVSPVATSITPGQTFTYTVTAENLGNVPQTGLSFFDDLTDVVDDATYNNDVNATIGSASFDGGSNRIEWNGDLGVGQTATITYSLTMNTPDTGDGRLDNGVVASGTGVNCTEDPAVDPDCLTTTPLPVVTSQKTLVNPANPQAGDTVNYQFVITNQGGAAAATVPVADDLSEVLDDAAYNNDAAATSGSLSYNPLTQRLSWSGNLAANGSAGDSVTVSYSVTVNDATNMGDAMLNNAVISPDCPDPPIFDTGDPDYEANCVTSTPVSAWMAHKTVVPNSDIIPGSSITYTIAVENTGAVDLTNLSIEDDMTDVLDDAIYNNDASASSGTPTFTSPTLDWTGDLTSGQTATITYSATVKSEDSLGNSSIANAIGAGPMNCPVTPTSNPTDPNFNASCATLTLVDTTDATPPPTTPSSGGLADTGQNLFTVVLAATALIAGGVVLAMKKRLFVKG